MTIEFNIGSTWSNKEIAITYSRLEYSFDFTPNTDSHSPLVINDINLSINYENVLLGIWGFCPHTQWENMKCVPPKSERRDIYIKDEHLPSTGVPIRVNNPNWNIYFNERGRWLCLGKPNAFGRAIEFVPGAILVLSESGKIISLWILVA